MYKPDLVFVKENKAFVVDVTVRYEHIKSSLKDAADEKVKKYQCLLPYITELTNAADIEFIGFLVGAWGKWYPKNSKLLSALDLSKTRLEKTAGSLASRALHYSVDIVHMFVSKTCSVVPNKDEGPFPPVG